MNRVVAGVALVGLSFLAASCTSAGVCDNADGVCVAVSVRGAGSVDLLRVHASGAVSGDKDSKLDHAASLPVELAARFSGTATGKVDLVVSGWLAGQLVGVGFAQADLSSTRSVAVDLTSQALPDLAAGADLSTTPADLSGASDLAVVLDLSAPLDIADPGDLSAPGDLATPADLTPPPDLAKKEICNNAVDDDLDGLVDCADPDCGTFACVPQAPSGWSGPFQLYDGPTASSPACGGTAFPTEVYAGNSGLNAPPVTCSGCTCGLPGASEVGCCANTVTGYNGAGCSGATTFTRGVLAAPNDCSCSSTPVSASVMWNVALCTQSGAPSTSIGCKLVTASTVTNRPAPTWTNLGRACSANASAASGCSSGNVCVPKPSAPFGAKLCVSQAGDVACPAMYTVKKVFYQGNSDGRTCGACNCGTVSGASFSCNLTVYYGQLVCCDSSTNQAFTNVNGNVCAPGQNAVDFGYARTTTVNSITGGTCAGTGGGGATGTVSPTMPTTFCCLP